MEPEEEEDLTAPLAGPSRPLVMTEVLEQDGSGQGAAPASVSGPGQAPAFTEGEGAAQKEAGAGGQQVPVDDGEVPIEELMRRAARNELNRWSCLAYVNAVGKKMR
jgi:hypothetical protein